MVDISRSNQYNLHFVKACVKYLLMSESRGDMIDKFQKEFEGIWPRDFVNYFKERVLPKANRLGKWELGEVNIYDESFFNHAGESCVIIVISFLLQNFLLQYFPPFHLKN